jgi:hypothetical protein
MKGKFGIEALLFSSLALAGPVSTPNQLSDTPIISGGGNVNAGTCQAYQTNGTAIDLTGGETLVFYGSGGGTSGLPLSFSLSFGGYLSTKPNYSGTAYVRVKMGNCYRYYCSGGAIGVFAQNTDSKNDFIAGAGAGGTGRVEFWAEVYTTYDHNASSGGGWEVAGWGEECDDPCRHYHTYGGGVYHGLWFTAGGATPGFHGRYYPLGAASSISAWYNSYTKNYTSFATSLTISGGGFYGRTNPTLYVCK